MTDPVTETPRKPGRPKKTAAVPVTETQEFKDAVSAAATKAAAEILASLTANQGGQTRQGDAGFAEGLAMAIAQLSSQGTGRAKPVAPEVIAARNAAREEMTRLIVDARANGQVPTYKLRNQIYFAETLLQPVYIDPASKEQRPTEIDWLGVPNEALIPSNDVAKAIYQAFSNSIGVVQIDSTKFIKPEHYAVTASGLVIRGGSLATQPLRPVEVGGGNDAHAEEGLRVHRGDGGKAKTINVLGTVASPARVNAV